MIDNQKNDDVVNAFRGTPFKTVQSVAFELGVSRRTVARRNTFADVNAYRPTMKPKLTEQHKLNRLCWAHEHVR